MLTVGVAAGGVLAAALLARGARRAEIAGRTSALARRPAVPAPVFVPLDRALVAAGVDLDVNTALIAWFGAMVMGVLLGLTFAPPAAFGGFVVGVVGPPSVLHAMRGRKDRNVARALPALLDGVAAHLATGGTVRSALDDAVTRATPLTADLRRLIDRLALGSSLDGALRAWIGERDIDGLRAVAGALATAHDLGGAASGALVGLASSLRDRAAVVAEARAQSTQARWSAGVVGIAPLAYLAFTAMADRSTFAVLVGDPIGRVCLVSGLALLGAGAAVMRRMVKEPA